MRWSDVADAVGAVAPGIGGAVAGPAGAAVGRLVANALGVRETPEAVSAALREDPEAALKLLKVEADLEAVTIEARAGVIIAEAKGESWLQRNWRPLLMLFFSALVGAHWLGLSSDTLSEPMVLSMYDIVQVGTGGYIAGRSAEKIARTVTGRGLYDRLKGH